MSKIKVSLDEHVRQCDHCEATNIKRTFKVQIPELEDTYIGRVCISKITKIDTSGNPYRAAARIQQYFNSLDIDEVINLLAELDEG